ncbi:MAG: C-terminal helicase domain-containing protein, partial [Phycisphaerae bacterium]
PVKLSANEMALYSALREYRNQGHAALSKATASERWVGQFIYSLMTKRLLSCPYAFARTWWRHLDHGPQDDTTTIFDMARVSAERAEEQTRSDEERSVLEADAARYSGTWFRSRNATIEELQGQVTKALVRLGYDQAAVEDETKLPAIAKHSDAKTEALVQWIKKNMFVGGKIRDDERLIVFTEYKETLFYLEKRLLQEGFDKNTLRLLYGGMDANEFEAIKGEFEDPAAAVRLLLATDAASEGINMQASCRWIVHYDIPWSPSKLQQRNGRVSRYGQERDVSIHYFHCDEEEDQQFLFYVAQKVEQVRNDLGSVEQVFDTAIQRHFSGKKIDLAQIDMFVEGARTQSKDKADLGVSNPEELSRMMRRAKELLESTDGRLGISPQALMEILRTAIAVEGQGALEDIPDRPGFYRLKPPPRWEGLVSQTLSVGRTDRMEIVFDTALIEEEVSGRRVMRLKKHQVLLRLGHPVMRQAMATLCRQLHDPTASNPIFRWSLAALHKTNFEALLAFHYTVTAINDLREPLHDEVLTQVFRIEGDKLSPVEASFRDDVLHSQFLPIKSAQKREEWTRTLRTKWLAHRRELEAFLKSQEQQGGKSLPTKAAACLKSEVAAATEGYRYRLQELHDRSREQELTKLAKELLRQRAGTMQPALFETMTEEAEVRVEQLEEQITVLRQDVERTRDLLTKDRDHRLNVILPKRFGIREVRVLPLALVYLVPATGEDLLP